MIVSQDKFGYTVVTMSSGAVVKLREDDEGDLEIRETTHRYLTVKPMARNTVYIGFEDLTIPSSVVLVNNPKEL